MEMAFKEICKDLFKVCVIFLFIGIPFFIIYYIYPTYAEYKAKNIENILDGCAYYYGESCYRNGCQRRFNIDGVLTDNKTLKDAPINRKYQFFIQDAEKNPNMCLHIKYVKVGILYNQVYI